MSVGSCGRCGNVPPAGSHYCNRCGRALGPVALPPEQRWIYLDLPEPKDVAYLWASEDRAELVAQLYERFVPFADDGWEWVVHPADRQFTGWVERERDGCREVVGAVGDVAVDRTLLIRASVTFHVHAPGVEAEAREMLHRGRARPSRHLQIERRAGAHRGAVHEQDRAALFLRQRRFLVEVELHLAFSCPVILAGNGNVVR